MQDIKDITLVALAHTISLILHKRSSWYCGSVSLTHIYSLGTSRCSSLTGVAKKGVIHNIMKSLLNRFSTCLVIVTKSSKTFSSSRNRTIFVWPWNENARTREKQLMNGNRALWLVCWMDTNGANASPSECSAEARLHARRTFKKWIDTLLWHYSAKWLAY